MNFSSLYGYAGLNQQLVGAYQRNHIAHAQLFLGVEGGAALPLALAYAMYLLCENKQAEDACGSCRNCLRVKKLIHPDLHFFLPTGGKQDEDEMSSDLMKHWRQFFLENPYGTLNQWITSTGAENKQIQLGKEVARQIIKTVSMKAFEGGMKILIIWYPEYLNSSAANALLKILEEPPPHTLYLLVSYEHESILPTILSRTQLVVVPPQSSKDIEEQLIASQKMEIGKARQMAKKSHGSYAKALELLEEEAETSEFTEFQEWMRSCYSYDLGKIQEFSESFSTKSKQQQIVFLEYSLEQIRNAILFQEAQALVNVNSDLHSFFEKFTKAVNFEALAASTSKINGTIGFIIRNANAKMAFFALSVSLAQIIRGDEKA